MNENLQHPQDLRRCFVIGNDEPKFSLLCSGLFRNLEPARVCIKNLYIYIIYIYIYVYVYLHYSLILYFNIL